MKNLVDILKQFSQKQRLIVLVICLIFCSFTYMFTTWVKSDSASCKEVIDLNKRYVRDFVAISDLVRRQKMQEAGLGDHIKTDSSAVITEKAFIEDSSVVNSQADILDSILNIAETATN